MDNSVKSSIRNFSDMKQIVHQEVSMLLDSPSMIAKIMEEALKKFTKRYLIITIELEEMKREFIGEIALVNEYITSARKTDKSQAKSSKSNESSSIEQKKPNKKEDKSKAKLVKDKIKIENDSKKDSNKRNNNDSKASDKGRKEGNNRLNIFEAFVSSNTKRHSSRSESKKIKKEAITNFLQKEKPKERKRGSSASYIVKPNKGRILNKDSNLLHNKYSSEKNKKTLSMHQNKLYKAVSVLANSQVLQLKEKIKLCYLNKEILSSNKPIKVVNDTLNILKNKIAIIESKKDDAKESMNEKSKSELKRMKKEYDQFIQWRDKYVH